jgi:two-component sensor histidine kinase
VLNWQDGRLLPSELNAAVERVREQGQAVETEIAIPDGRTLNFFAIHPLNEDYINLYGMDLTEHKRVETALRDSEEHLKTSLGEKDVLLKEIHHRVKNNMQVISSLVDLQADEVGDAALRGIFQDVVNRVRSMAMVHEKLYQSGDLARVEFADYTETLLGYLWRALKGAASGIQLDLDLAPVFLPVNLAVPCGLVLNELFSNALKHAFNGRESGRVTVSLQEDADGKVQLEVRDDGIGLPPGLDSQKAGSLGLRLVQMLARQLKATVAVKSDSGTVFTITFKGPKSCAGKPKS